MKLLKDLFAIATLLIPASINAAALDASATISGTNNAFLVGIVTVDENFSDINPASSTDPVAISESASFKGLGQTGTTLGVVNVEGFDNGFFSLSTFGQGNHLNESAFRFSEVITNSSAQALQFNMDFLISAGQLKTQAYEVTQQGNEFLEATYGISIGFAGTELFQSSATLRQVAGIDDSSTTSSLGQIGTTLGGSFTQGNLATYSWDAFNGNLILGILNAGESGLLEYSIFTRGSGQFDMCGSSGCGSTRASIGDPINLSSIGAQDDIAGVPVRTVPEPPIFLLLFTGLLGLMISRGRRDFDPTAHSAI